MVLTKNKEHKKYQEEQYVDKIKLGYAPTRRSIFSAPDARKYRGLIADPATSATLIFSSQQ